MQQVRTAKSVSNGPLVYVGIVPSGDALPDLPLRAELVLQLKELTELCACVHLVLEGGGFGAAAKRAVATGMFLLTGRHGRVTAHASIHEALYSCRNLTAPAAEILASESAVLTG
jgi:hypothetical protein